MFLDARPRGVIMHPVFCKRRQIAGDTDLVCCTTGKITTQSPRDIGERGDTFCRWPAGLRGQKPGAALMLLSGHQNGTLARRACSASKAPD
jgi:hypothetical protein